MTSSFGKVAFGLYPMTDSIRDRSAVRGPFPMYKHHCYCRRPCCFLRDVVSCDLQPHRDPVPWHLGGAKQGVGWVAPPDSDLGSV